jgi:hypothetical protein
MHTSLTLTTILLLVLTLIGGCTGVDESTASGPLTPLDFKPIDPDDTILIKAVRQFLENSEGPVASTYEYARIDLNDDKRRDALVLFKTPFGYWCGTHGCTMLVLRAHNDHFSLVNAIQPVREPVYISPQKSRGWNNIVLRVSGRWDEAKDVAMRYNGRQYPEDPSRQPHQPRNHNDGSIRIFE